MKKNIRVNTKILKESSIKVGDKNYEQRLRRRVTDLRRVSQMAKSAAIKAEEAGNTELAKKLNDRVEEIEKLLATYNIDTIDPEEIESENTDKDELDKEGGEEDEDSEDTDKDESEGEDKEGSDEEDQDDNSEIDDIDSIDDDNSVDNKEDNNKNNTKKDGPEKEGKDIPDGGDFDPKNDTEVDPVDPTKDEKDPNKEEESKDDDSKEGGDWNPEEEKEDKSEDETEEGGDWGPEGSDEEEKKDSDIDSEDTDDTKKDKSEKDDSEDDTEEGGDEDPEEDEDSDTETDKNNKKSKGKKGSNGEDDSDDEEDDSDEEETDDSPIKDPFADEEDIPDLNLGGGTQEPRDATLKDIIKQLKGLSSEGKRGALAALQDIINSRKPTTESLTEAVKGVREMTDDEFGDYINSTYDLIDQVEALDYEDEEELKKKKAKVGQWSTDPKTLKELEDEDNVSLEKDFRKEKAREKENTKYAKVGTLDEFKLNFYNAIKHQVEMVIQEYQSYNEINAEYESEDVIMKADLTQEIPEEVIPVIDIYFDVSGSWYPEDIEIGRKAIATVKEFEDAGEIKINIFYFGDVVSSEYEVAHRYGNAGTTAWRLILQNIKATGAQNVLVMTDDDIERIGQLGKTKPAYAPYGAIGGPTCKVDGCVWFLWKNGESSPSCADHLIGRQGNYQYAFYR